MALLVPVKQAAKSCNASAAHFYRLIRKGRIPFYRLSPRTTRIDLDELRAYVRQFPESLSKKVGE